MQSLDRQVTLRSTWGPFSLTHNITEFNGDGRCETGSTQFWSHLAKFHGYCPSEGGDKTTFCISLDQIVNESRDSLVEIPSP